MPATEISPLTRLPVKKLRRWPMSEFTSLRLGGEADLILFPRNMDDLRKVVVAAGKEDTPLYPLGGGTNLLVRDGGIRGALVSLLHGFNGIAICENGGNGAVNLRAGAGASMGQVCLFALMQGLEGLEGLIGIPGSLGGCLTMNAGANSASIGDSVKRVKMLTESGETIFADREEINFGYRKAEYPARGIILEAELSLKKGHGEDLRRRAQELTSKRLSSKCAFPFNAGSIFKNPEGYHAGALIEECGLKGECEGDAQISPVHGNIIVNRGRASASDVLKLMDRARKMVFSRSGIELEEEIKVVGEGE
jgi:UDP-N-acetylmuramate dehydrogenase